MLWMSWRAVKWCGRVFAVVGGIMLAVSLGTAIHTYLFVQSAARCEGTIVRFIERYDRDSGVTYRPVFTFRDANQVAHEVSSMVGSNPPAFAVGAKVSVLYDTTQPDRAALERWSILWFLPLLFGGVGTLFTAFAFVLLALARWAKHSQTGPSCK